MGVVLLALGIFGTGGLVTQVHDEVSKSVRSVAPVISEDSANDVVSVLAGFKETGKLPEKWSWERVANLLASSDPGLFCQQKEALENLRTLPANHQRTYELSVDEKAKGAYTDAEKRDDPEAMLKVALAYPTHPRGKDALNWLGTYLLNRGEFGSAHSFYQELTRGKEAKKGDEKIWVKAALAAHQVGDAKLRDAAFKVLKERKVEIRVEDETLDADDIEEEILAVDASTKDPGLALEHLKEALEKPYASTGFHSLHARWLARHNPALLKDVASQLGNPRKFLSVGFSNFCTVLKEREVSCFYGTINLAKRVFRKPIKQLVSTNYHTCALHSDGTVWCWTTKESEPATELKAFSEAKEINANGTTLCAVHGNEQKVSCAELFANRAPRVWSTGHSSLKQISAFNEYGCGTDAKNGELRCWEELGASSGIRNPPKAKKGSPVAVGEGYACILEDGKPVCWGDKRSVASVPSGLKDITALSLGMNGYGSGSCAVTKQETVVCWGGSGRRNQEPPKGLKGVLRVSSNGWATCADTRSQGVVCWGTALKGLPSRSAEALQPDYFLSQLKACPGKKKTK